MKKDKKQMDKTTNATNCNNNKVTNGMNSNKKSSNCNSNIGFENEAKSFELEEDSRKSFELE